MQAMHSHRARVVAIGEHQAIVKSQQEWAWCRAPPDVANDQGLPARPRAVLTFQVRDKRQLSGIRAPQSINRVGLRQPSLPPRPGTGRWPSDDLALLPEKPSSTRAREPSARMHRCQPLSWKIRCTVFSCMPSTQV